MVRRKRRNKKGKNSRADRIMLLIVILCVVFVAAYIFYSVQDDDFLGQVDLPFNLSKEKVYAVLECFMTRKAALMAILLAAAAIPYMLIDKLVYTVRRRRYRNSPLSKLDQMDGIEFEHYAVWILKLMGYTHCRVTKPNNDFGADVIANRDGKKTVVQVKRYRGNVGIEAVQQVVASKAHYKAEEAAVFTNSYLTDAAKTLARENNVAIIDRDTLYKFGVKSAFKQSGGQTDQTKQLRKQEKMT